MADIPGLVDQYGRPIQRQLLMTRVAGATVTGIRQAIRDNVSGGLTPEGLAAMMRAADANDPENYFKLAEEMEEKNLHYVSVLGTRKRQVSQLPMTVQAASKDPADKAAADLVNQDLIDSGVIDEYLFDMLDAVGKGFSLGEIMWDLSGSAWKPTRINYVDPRFVRFDRATMEQPLLLDDSGVPQPLPPYKFIYLKLAAKSGIAVRGGIVRAAAWAYLFKNYALKDWVQFAEVYGLPIRVGKFAPGASEDDKADLLRALSMLGTDAAGIIPQNMMIEFVESAGKGASSDLYKTLATYMDDQMSKAVLGQTGTTDSSGAKGLGSGTEHTQVREDIERSDAKAISAVFSRQLVRAYIDLNLGPRPRYPWLKIGREDEADAAQMISAATSLIPFGFRVRQSDVRDAVGFAEPEADDELFTLPAPPPPAALPGTLPGRLPLPANDQRAAASRTLARAMAAALDAGQSDTIDTAIAAELENWKEVFDPIGNQILNLASQSSGLEDFRARLVKLYPQIDTNALANKLAILTFQSFGGGAIGEEP